MKVKELKPGDQHFKSTIVEEDRNRKKKRCPKCKKYKLLKMFAKRNDRPQGVQSRCKSCFKSYSLKLTKKRQLKENREAYKEYNRNYYYTPQGKAKAKRANLSMYGLTLEQWEGMLEKQNHCCAICKEKLTKPCTDHDHKIHKVREILCDLCNGMLGFSKDNPATLISGAEYILKHRRMINE